jgi:hypothetical protein
MHDGASAEDHGHAAGEIDDEAGFDSGWHRQQHVNSK